MFYKVRAVYRETNYGPQLDIRKIREVVEADAADGFDPTLCLPQSRFEPQQMFEEMLAIVRERITDAPLRALVEKILLDNRDELLRIPAARHNHHAFVGRLAGTHAERDADVVYLADKYAEYYPEHEAAAGQADGRGRRRSCTTSASSASWSSGPKGTVYTAERRR